MTDQSAQPTLPTAETSLVPTSPASPRSRTALILVAICLAGWMSWLCYLAMQGSEPVVNQRQIRRAPIVVTAKVVSIEKKLVEVEKTWVGEPEGATLGVRNLDKVPVVEGESYVMPLWADGRIVRISDPNVPGSGAPAVYPATDGVGQQVQDLLAP